LNRQNPDQGIETVTQCWKWLEKSKA